MFQYLAIASLVLSLQANAGEGIETKVSNAASDVKTTMNKATRKLGRKSRKVLGKDSAAQDADDKAKDAQDEAENKAQHQKKKD